MTRDDIRKLIGGYATGTLTEAERKLLFEAALDDQDLFDELAHEQALKEVLDEPGAKQRLIAGLAMPEVERAWWKRPVIWVATALVAAGAAAVSIVAVRPSRPVQMAKLSPAEVAAPLPAPPSAKPANEPTSPTTQPAAALRAPAPKPATKGAALRDAAEATEKEKAASAEPEKREADKLEKDADQKAAKVEELAVNGRRADAAPPPAQVSAPAPPQASPQTAQTNPQTAQAGGQVQSLVDVQGAPFPQSQQQNGQPQQSGRLGGGGARAGQAGASAPAARKAQAAQPRRFAFEYRLQSDGYLIIKVSGDGYLSVGTTCLKCDGIGSLFSRFVTDGSTTSVIAPTDKASDQVLAIIFSAKPESMTKPTVFVERKTLFGTLEDPNPTSESTLVLRLERPSP